MIDINRATDLMMEAMALHNERAVVILAAVRKWANLIGEITHSNRIRTWSNGFRCYVSSGSGGSLPLRSPTPASSARCSIYRISYSYQKPTT
ncbi:hypothetical protein EVAR_80671_1 [Eumeta japonica]|uniref:Uncharacterized protein n=1 Tax=Eumeta variegata TaxID=151549 RepID=A0A4C1U469_EUMVA|nr:hypothetical protein EVAR_80671_1 [Eumeta japonica]